MAPSFLENCLFTCKKQELLPKAICKAACESGLGDIRKLSMHVPDVWKTTLRF
jgi:hypothetical protein